MKFRGLLTAAVVLLVLAGLLFWSNRRKETAPPPTISKSPTIVRVTPADVTSVTVKQTGAPPVTVTRQSADKWQITAPAGYPADTSAVTGILTSLNPLLADQVVEDKATNLTPFGLANPAVEVDVTSKDGKSHQVLVGDDTPAGGNVYVAMAGDPRVFTAASYIRTSLSKNLNDLRDKRLLPVDADSVTTMELNRKGQAIVFGRVHNGWQIQKPKAYRTDTFQVDDLLQQAVGAKWDPATSVEDAKKDFAKATPVATLKLTGSSGTDTLEVRKDENNSYFVKSSALSGAYKIDPAVATAVGEALNRPLDDFRNKQVFDFGFSDPDKIEYHAGSTDLVLTHSGNDWTSNGKKMDTDSVERVVTALRDLAAAKFVDRGYTKPDIEITVTSADGKKVEKTGIQKTKDGGIAKRDDGPSLYSLDGVTLDGLTSAIAGVKPAAPAKKK
jgi:hypothetical protein